MTHCSALMCVRALAAFAAALGMTACGGTADGDVAPGGTREGYPAGAPGVREGDVIANHTFVTAEGAPFALADVYRDARNRVLLVSTASEWCTACFADQPVLQAMHEAYGPRGLFVLLAVFEDADERPAGVAHAARWKERRRLTFTVVADTPFVLGAYYDSTLTPMTMLVDVDDMTILRVTTGLDESAVRGIIEARL